MVRAALLLNPALQGSTELQMGLVTMSEKPGMDSQTRLSIELFFLSMQTELTLQEEVQMGPNLHQPGSCQPIWLKTSTTKIPNSPT